MIDTNKSKEQSSLSVMLKKADSALRSHSASADKLKKHQQNFTKKTKDAFEKVASQFKDVVVDPKVVISHRKKNLEVLNHTHKKTTEAMKSIATLQGQFVKQTCTDLNAVMRGMIAKKTAYKVDHAENMRHYFQRAFDHAYSMRGILADSHKEINARLHGRMEEAKTEAKAYIAKKAY